MKDQLNANYYIDLLENIHPSFDTNQRIVNGYQLMPNNSLNIYEIYTKSNLTQILERFRTNERTNDTIESNDTNVTNRHER